MAVVLLDTNVASFLHPKRRSSPQRKAYSPQRKAYSPDLAGHTLALSFQSVGELFYWAEQNNWGPAQRAALDRLLSRFVIIPYDIELARAWARVMTHAKAIGRRLDAGDAWIAATALRHQLRLITHDADFEDLGLSGVDVVRHA
jgi:tRNA(fMet)-specific endonuclease VapC